MSKLFSLNFLGLGIKICSFEFSKTSFEKLFLFSSKAVVRI
ncbi:MAG: hypothetical protein VW916_05060 [Flavobacteriaceae bacterium]